MALCTRQALFTPKSESLKSYIVDPEFQSYYKKIIEVWKWRCSPQKNSQKESHSWQEVKYCRWWCCWRITETKAIYVYCSSNPKIRKHICSFVFRHKAEVNSLLLYQLDVIIVKLIKSFLYKKRMQLLMTVLYVSVTKDTNWTRKTR